MIAKLIAASLLVVTVNAFADDAQTGSLYIAGEIPVVTTIEVLPEAGIESLDLLNPSNDHKVASVKERNNTWKGYVVTMKSKHAGHLAREGGLLHAIFNNIKYSAKYGGKDVKLSWFPQVVYSSSYFNLFSQARDIDLSISYEGTDASSKLAGTYSDTLTMTISAR